MAVPAGLSRRLNEAEVIHGLFPRRASVLPPAPPVMVLEQGRRARPPLRTFLRLFKNTPWELWCDQLLVISLTRRLEHVWNLENLVCMEVAGLRLQMLEEAHRFNPEAPSHEGVAHFMGD